MNETEQLRVVFERLGTTRAQAETMAAQLLRRAEQHARERGVTPAAALARLLELVVQARAGELPVDRAAPHLPPPPAANPKNRVNLAPGSDWV